MDSQNALQRCVDFWFPTMYVEGPTHSSLFLQGLMGCIFHEFRQAGDLKDKTSACSCRSLARTSQRHCVVSEPEAHKGCNLISLTSGDPHNLCFQQHGGFGPDVVFPLIPFP